MRVRVRAILNDGAISVKSGSYFCEISVLRSKFKNFEGTSVRTSYSSYERSGGAPGYKSNLRQGSVKKIYGTGALCQEPGASIENLCVVHTKLRPLSQDIEFINKI